MKWRIAPIGASLLLLVSLSQAQDQLSYRDRGDRAEGVRSKPVGGQDIVLLGAMVEPLAPAELPEKLTIAFFLADPAEVFLTVREREPRTYYWLDKVRPAVPWRPKATNSFTWRSDGVLQPLGLNAAQLVALARLGNERSSLRETVAPVVFSPNGVPRPVSDYRFIFKVNAAAKIGYQLYGQSAEPVASGTKVRRIADVPFDIPWDASQQSEGRYRLLLDGYRLSDNVPISYEVSFFHSPTWPR